MSSVESNNPLHIEELFQKACYLHEQKQYNEAETIYRTLSDAYPDAWILRYNLGLLYFEQNKFEKALSEYQTALDMAGPDNDILYNLAICQKQCGLIEQAIDSYILAIDLDPSDKDSMYNLAGCYSLTGDIEHAVKLYCDVLIGDPLHQSSLNNLAYLYHKSGDKKNALKYYARLLEVNSNHPSAEHMIAALSGHHKKKAPIAYIRDVFDQFADHYEDSLTNKLHYNVPEKLAEFTTGTSGKNRFNKILDLGCGTGLSGEVFKNYCCIIDGIDLSEKMVSIALKKNIYNNILIGNIETLLTNHPEQSYDLIIAADVLTYLGDLTTIFSGAHKVGTESGMFYFSVEHLPEQSLSFLLQESGRFAHSRGYIIKTAENNGWRLINDTHLKLRKENGIWVEGMLYGFKKRQLT